MVSKSKALSTELPVCEAVPVPLSDSVRSLLHPVALAEIGMLRESKSVFEKKQLSK